MADSGAGPGTTPAFRTGAVRRRASARVTLVLIGAASVAGCSDPPPPPMQRDVYQHRSQCVQDWGDEKKCEVITSGTHRGYYYGPGYSATGSETSSAPRRGSRAVATDTVSRGGFGSSASAHSSGS